MHICFKKSGWSVTFALRLRYVLLRNSGTIHYSINQPQLSTCINHRTLPGLRRAHCSYVRTMADAALLLQSETKRHAPYPATSSSHDVQTHGEENHPRNVPHAGQHDREHCEGEGGESITVQRAVKHSESGQSERF